MDKCNACGWQKGQYTTSIDAYQKSKNWQYNDWLKMRLPMDFVLNWGDHTQHGGYIYICPRCQTLKLGDFNG